MASFRSTNILLSGIAIVFILIQTKNLLIPFILALIIWYIIREVKNLLRRNKFIKNRFPLWLQNGLVFVLIFMVIGGIAELLSSSIQSFAAILPAYEANVQKINKSILDTFNFDVWESLRSYSGTVDFSSTVQPILNSLTSILGDGFMIIIYCVFLLLEESVFRKKFEMIFSSEGKFEEAKAITDKIDNSFSNYISLKSLVSLLTAGLSFIVLLIIGVDVPILWAFIIFLLNYIPSIGSLIATAFPAIVAMLQFGEVMPGIYVLAGVGAIQILVGNVIEPKVMGDSLNISPLVVIISLIIWGAIWGVLGMVLSVPITVMLIIILAQFPATRNIAIMLSSNGILEKPKEDPPPVEEPSSEVEVA